MKKSEFYNAAKFVLIVSLLFWASETAFFGFKMYPIKEIEKTCDNIVKIAFKIGLILLITPAISEYIKWLKKD